MKQYILSSYLNINRNVVVILEYSNTENTKSIINSLRKAQNEFTALRLKIIEINNCPYFLPSVDFTDIVIKVVKSSLHDEDIPYLCCEEEMNIPFECGKSMWRGTIIELTTKKYLILTLHHAIFDGRSIIKLLNFLESIEKEALQCRNSIKIAPAIEDCINIKPNRLCQSKQEKKIPYILNRFPIYKYCNINQQKSKYTKISIDEINIEQLKRFCKENKLTINQLLNAISIKSAHKIFKNNNETPVHTPVDLTSYVTTGELDNEIGCFVTVIHSAVKDYKQMTLVELAREYANSFHQGLATQKIEQKACFKELKSSIIDKFPSVTNEYHGGIAISNIGEINLYDGRNSKIKDVIFSTSLTGGLGIFVLSILSYNGKFNISLTYTEPLISRYYINKFTIEFKFLFKKLALEIIKDKQE